MIVTLLVPPAEPPGAPAVIKHTSVPWGSARNRGHGGRLRPLARQTTRRVPSPESGSPRGSRDAPDRDHERARREHDRYRRKPCRCGEARLSHTATAGACRRTGTTRADRRGASLTGTPWANLAGIAARKRSHLQREQGAHALAAASSPCTEVNHVRSG